jgi:hypothetical protein
VTELINRIAPIASPIPSTSDRPLKHRQATPSIATTIRYEATPNIA